MNRLILMSILAMLISYGDFAKAAPQVKSDTQPPLYEQKFETSESTEGFVILDANADNRKWTWYKSAKAMRIMYNPQKDMDDWLITPAITLEGGRKYRISVAARNNSSSNHEEFEVWLGTAATAEAMTLPVIQRTQLPANITWNSYEQYVTIPSSGTYYLGVHGVSPKNKDKLYITNIVVSAPVAEDVPASPAAYSVIPDINGAMKVAISGTAPDTTIGGNPLSSLTMAILSRDDQPIDTLTSIQPGQRFSFTDNKVEQGYHTYSVACHNANGAGRSASEKVFVGLYMPGTVTDIRISEPSHGKVHLSWTPPVKDQLGKNLGNTPLTYRIVDVLNTTQFYADDYKGTSWDSLFYTGSGQIFFRAGIFARTSSGLSQRASSPFIAIGVPYQLPYSESVPGGKAVGLLGTTNISGEAATWYLCKNGDNGISSSDSDNGYIACRQTKASTALCMTGKVDLRRAANPNLSVAVYKPAGEANSNIIELVASRPGGEWKTVLSGTVSSLCGAANHGWVPVNASLKAFNGREVQVGVRITRSNTDLTCIDAIQVTDSLSSNLTLTAIETEPTALCHTPFDIKATIANHGTSRAEGYRVEFMRSGSDSPAGVAQGPALAPGNSIPLSIRTNLGFEDCDTLVRYSARIVWENDLNPADNLSDTLTVRRRYNILPSPSGLEAHHGGKGTVRLSWQQADPASIGVMHESFEFMRSFSCTGSDGWTLIDGDRAPIGYFLNTVIPENPKGSLRSFFVLDDTYESFNHTFAAQSGHKYLASMYVSKGTNNDWVITPPLRGDAQPVSFYAKSYTPSMPESIEMLYSTATTTDTIHFRSLQKVDKVPGTWTRYEIAVPRGATRFAVRSYSKNATLLMVDDFSYLPAIPAIKGYNVYRDGQLLNSLPVEGLSYTDNSAAEGEHIYRVAAAYAEGESAPTDAALFAGSVIAPQNSNSTIFTSAGHLYIYGAEGRQVTVYTASGILCHASTPSSTLSLPLAPGLYIVSVGSHNSKILVK